MSDKLATALNEAERQSAPSNAIQYAQLLVWHQISETLQQLTDTLEVLPNEPQAGLRGLRRRG